MPERQYRVLARDKSNNNVRQVYRLSGGFTRNEKATGRKALFSKREAKQAEAWGKKRGLAVWITKSKYPFLVLDNDTDWGNKELAKRANELGRRRKRYMWCGEFKRSARRQWEFRMMQLNGTGNLAARCCTKYWGKHSWAQCGKNPLSNHADGNAVDISMLHSGRSGAMTNVGHDDRCRKIMRDLNLCLPVGCGCQKEPWHMEIGTRWCA